MVKTDRHFCPFPGLRRKTLSLSPLRMIIVVGFICVSVFIFIQFHLFLIYWVFYHESVFDFVKCFFHVCWDNCMLLFLYSINMVCIDWFSYGDPTLHSGINPICFWIQFASISLRIFISTFIKVFMFSCDAFFLLSCQGNIGLIEWVRSAPSFIFLKEFKKAVNTYSYTKDTLE